jgi:hypothetical protein
MRQVDKEYMRRLANTVRRVQSLLKPLDQHTVAMLLAKQLARMRRYASRNVAEMLALAVTD